MGRRSGREARKHLAARVKRRLAVGLTSDKVRALSTDAMLARLAGFGIVTSADEFVEQARAEHAASAIADGWRERFPVSARGFEDDFIGIAATVLWERWLPERPSFEMLDERMQDGYVALWTNDDVVRACDRWLEVWEGFKLHLGPDQARVRDVDTLFHGTEYFINWCQEFENELGNAGVHDPRYWRAWCQVKPIGFSMNRFCQARRHPVQTSYMMCG